MATHCSLRIRLDTFWTQSLSGSAWHAVVDRDIGWCSAAARTSSRNSIVVLDGSSCCGAILPAGGLKPSSTA